MLTDSNDKYKMCPIFNHIISRDPRPGDFMFTMYNMSVIQDVYVEHDDENDEDCDMMKYYSLFRYGNSANYTDYTSDMEYKYANYVLIDKELADIILKYVGKVALDKIYDIVVAKDTDEDDEIYLIYMFLYRIYCYVNSLVTDEMDKMILLSFGIKKVLKKHKNKGMRDVLLGDGSIWRIKRKHMKGCYGKRMRTVNRRSNVTKKSKSVRYTLIKRLDFNEVVIS